MNVHMILDLMTAVMLGTTRTGDVVGVIMTTVEVAATMIVVGIMTGIGTVIETVAMEVIMIVGVMMTESGDTEGFQGEGPVNKLWLFPRFLTSQFKVMFLWVLRFA